jgi:hypothetical protein
VRGIAILLIVQVLQRFNYLHYWWGVFTNYTKLSDPYPFLLEYFFNAFFAFGGIVAVGCALLLLPIARGFGLFCSASCSLFITSVSSF